jgi:hypothetical protein
MYLLNRFTHRRRGRTGKGHSVFLTLALAAVTEVKDEMSRSGCIS